MRQAIAKANQVARGSSQGVRQDWRAVRGEANRKLQHQSVAQGGGDTVSSFLGRNEIGFSGDYTPVLLVPGKAKQVSEALHASMKQGVEAEPKSSFGRG